MKMERDEMKIKGTLSVMIEDGDWKEERLLSNTILLTGKSAVVHSLGYDIGGSFQYYVDRMIFGDGGEESGVPKRVSVTSTSLNGDTRASVSASASFSPDVQNQIVFTSVLTGSHAVGYTLNEAALQLANGGLFSMVTFPGLPKTSTMTLTFNWTLTVV